MTHPSDIDSRQPLYRALPILDVVEAAPLDVVEEAPADVIEVAPPPPFVLPVESTEPPLVELASPRRSVPFRVHYAIFAVIEWLCGGATLMIGLAILAAIPILNLLSLGYLLEAGGRIARSGRLRDGFIGVRLAARLGGIVAASQVLLFPVYFVADMAKSAAIIDPGGKTAQNWRIGLMILIALTFVHIAATCARGLKLLANKEPWYFVLTILLFLWPFNVIWLAGRILRGGYYTEARDAVWDTVMSLRLPYYFWLGFRGFVGAFAWLVLPISLLAVSRFGQSGGASLLGFIGALMLAVILPYLPFLQMRLAQTNRLRGAFQLGAVRRDFGRAPWAFAFAFVVTLLFALPLYLLKIQIVPREAAWLPSLVFIVFIFPARLLTGWALGRANRRAQPRHWFFRWTGRLPFLPAAAFYVLIVFFTQYTSWNGVWSLYEQHILLVPVPFLGM